MSIIRLGVISDTHAYFDKKIPALFIDVAHILHVGDVESPHILDELRAIAPVTAVVGNVDTEPPLDRLPLFARLEFGGMHILMTHIIGRPTKLNSATAAEVQREKPDILLYGHTHLPSRDRINDILIFNPGSAGPKRFDQPRTMAMMEIRDGQVSADWISLD